MVIEIHEIVKEYVIMVHPMPKTVIKGRITKHYLGNGDERFNWDISHFFKHEGQNLYYPSKVTDDTFETAKESMVSYLKGFMSDTIIPNEFY